MQSVAHASGSLRREALHLASLLAALVAFHLATGYRSEPFFNNDETRHTMTGVFFRDAIADMPVSLQNPKAYAETYYLRYPALGLLVWPPLFHAVEGSAMLIFGPSFAVGRTVVAGFAVLMTIYSYRFARLTLGHFDGLLTAGFVGASPMIFMLSQRVMLEVPTLALALVAIVHFEKYLRDERSRDAILAGLFAACCALTRFDGVFLLPYFGIRIVATRRLRLLLRRPVVYSMFFSLLPTLPYYLVVFREYGVGLNAGAADGFADEPRGPLQLNNWLFYWNAIPELIGPVAASFVFVGALAIPVRGKQLGPALALIASVYFTFSPLAELEARHSIYWVPGLAIIAGNAVALLRMWNWPPLGAGLIMLVCGLLGDTKNQAFRFVSGYEEAAEYVVARNANDRPLFVDGELTGSFVYHVRIHDAERRQRVLRGDKLIYSMLSDPNHLYQQHAATEADVVRILHEYDPEWIVVETPMFQEVAGSQLLRSALKNNPDFYKEVNRVRLRTNYDHFADCTLVIYRKPERNPKPAPPFSIPVAGLGRRIGE